MKKFELIKAKVTQCIEQAERRYGIKMPNIDVRFDLRGRCAGVAGYRGNVFYVRFNIDHINSDVDFKHIIENTVSHEIAHSVCQAFPHLGKNHDAGWKRVCVVLGGNGKRCYTAEDAPEAIARIRPFVYTTTIGTEINITKVIHGKIQRGKSYIAKDGGKINQSCSYRVVA